MKQDQRPSLPRGMLRNPVVYLLQHRPALLRAAVIRYRGVKRSCVDAVVENWMPREAVVGTYRGECGCAGVDDTATTTADMSTYALLLTAYKAPAPVFWTRFSHQSGSKSPALAG